MTTPATSQQELKTYYYTFDLRRLPGNPLQRFDPLADFQMDQDPARYLAHYQYSLYSSPNEHLSYYRSAAGTDAEFLALVQIDGYRLVFHLHNDHAKVAWEQRFEKFLHRILQEPGVLPAPISDPLKNHEIIHLDPHRIARNGGWY